jgi:hypothetical protein
LTRTPNRIGTKVSVCAITTLLTFVEATAPTKATTTMQVRAAIFLSTFSVAHAALRVVPSFLSTKEIEDFRQHAPMDPEEEFPFRSRTTINIDGDMHKRIRQAMSEECIDHADETEVLVSTLFSDSPRHRDRHLNGEQVSVDIMFCVDLYYDLWLCHAASCHAMLLKCTASILNISLCTHSL